jgi:8-oxo-dGTP diphosphatase
VWQIAKEFHTDWNYAQAHHPHSVLVFPLFRNRLVWVLHPQRGWEVPGGKRERGESPRDALYRESMEEAGIHFRSVSWIGEYQFFMGNDCHYKWVYFGEVADVQSRPKNSEIIQVRVWPHLFSPQEIQGNRGMSPILQDDMYQHVYPLLVSATQYNLKNPHQR